MDESVGIVLGDLEGEHKVKGQGREEEYKHQEDDYRCISDTKVDMKSSDTVPAKINVKEETRKKNPHDSSAGGNRNEKNNIVGAIKENTRIEYSAKEQGKEECKQGEQVAGDERDGPFEDYSPIKPKTKAKFYTRQRVFAQDHISGMFYESIVRRFMFGPRSIQSIETEREEVGYFTSIDEEEAIDAEFTEKGNSISIGNESELETKKRGATIVCRDSSCWHYFVHYLGWNVKWDRWVEEHAVLQHSPEIVKLAQQMNKLAKAAGTGKRKRAQKELANDKRRLQEQIQNLTNGTTPEKSMSSRNSQVSKKVPETKPISIETKKELKCEGKKKLKVEAVNDQEKTSEKDRGNSEEKIVDRRMLKFAKQNLDAVPWKDLKLANRLRLPFTLKKILVDEWELIGQQQHQPDDIPSSCETTGARIRRVLPNLPSPIPIKSILDQYLKVKLDMFETKDSRQAVWIEMVNGISTCFDQFLPMILYYQEQAQYNVMMLNGSFADGNDTEKKYTPIHVYGCEHLLRLITKLPSLLADSETSMNELKSIIAKVGDLLRFLQKNQSTFFVQTYRSPRENELLLSEANFVGR